MTVPVSGSAHDRFLAWMDRTRNVPVSAAAVGVSRHVGYRWAKKAGLKSKRIYHQHPGRETYRQLRETGMSRSAAAAAAGVHYRTAGDWDRGVQKINSSRVYPDGRRVDYATKTVRDIARPRVDRPVHARFLSLDDRELIADLRRAGWSMRAIAARLNRPPSTISRELGRVIDGGAPGDPYRPHAAYAQTVANRARPKTAKLVEDSPLRRAVQAGLDERWSPEQIHHTLRQDHAGDEDMQVSTETIYQAIYCQARGGLRRELTQALRTGRTRRKPHRDPAARTSRFTDPMIMISERPAEVEDRAVPGHWEGDLIIGAAGGSAIGTLVERATRYVMLVHLPNGRTAEAVRDQLVATMATLPAHLRGSLTWDQGAEMAAHRSFSMATDMPVYFCDPASPWQRGSNENTNGLLRQYFPKGTDLAVHSPADLEHVAQQLNRRPRKTLDWATPAQRLRDLLQPLIDQRCCDDR